MKRLLTAAILMLLTTPVAANTPTPEQVRDLIVRLTILKQVADFCTDELWREAKGVYCRQQSEMLTPSLKTEIKAILDNYEQYADKFFYKAETDAMVGAQNLALPEKVGELAVEIADIIEMQKSVLEDQPQ